MKKNIFIIISCSLLIGTSIKESAVKDMRAMYKEKVQITEHKFSIPSKAKKKYKIKLNRNFIETKYTIGSLKRKMD